MRCVGSSSRTRRSAGVDGSAITRRSSASLAASPLYRTSPHLATRRSTFRAPVAPAALASAARPARVRPRPAGRRHQELVGIGSPLHVLVMKSSIAHEGDRLRVAPMGHPDVQVREEYGQDDAVGLTPVQTHARTEPLGLRHQLPGLVPAAAVGRDRAQAVRDPGVPIGCSPSLRRSSRRSSSRNIRSAGSADPER